MLDVVFWTVTNFGFGGFGFLFFVFLFLQFCEMFYNVPARGTC